MTAADITQEEIDTALAGVKEEIRTEINEFGYDVGIILCPFCGSQADWHIVSSGSLYVSCETDECLWLHVHHFVTKRAEQ